MAVVHWTLVRRFVCGFIAGICHPLDDASILTRIRKRWRLETKPTERNKKMKNDLRTVLSRIENDYKENILDDSRYYVEISIARKAEELGFDEVKKRYKDAYAIVPLKHSVGGMKVRIDGRTFVNFAQFDSGVVVPRYVASQVDEPHRAYVAKDSMICNFA